MTTPSQPARPVPAAPSAPAADPLEAWFDAELRPVLLRHLAAADGGTAAAADARHRATIAAVEHWLGSLAQRAGAWSPETRETVKVLMSELRGLLDSVGAF